MNQPSDWWGPASQDSRDLNHVHGHAHYAPWVNGHDAAHLQAKMVPTNLIWSESALWFLSSRAARFQEPLLCPWARPCGHRGQITAMLHIYRTRRFQRTWFAVNPSVVTESRHPQSLGRTNGQRAFHSSNFFPRKRLGTIKMCPQVQRQLVNTMIWNSAVLLITQRWFSVCAQPMRDDVTM